jgi:hypothetical protein
MASITGFGGAFIRANDPEALYEWYERHLGLIKAEGGFRVSCFDATRTGRLCLLRSRGRILSYGTESDDQPPGR